MISLLFLIAGCAYYNTFFNAKENYKLGIEKQKKVTGDQIGNDIKKHYNDAIEKSWKLIDVYGDSNKYADDALLLIGKSYYNLQDYAKAQRVLEQFILKYANSDLVPEAKLWLAKTFISIDDEKKALDILNTLFEQKVSNEVAAQAFYILGELYFKNEDYKKSIENLEKCIEITSDDEVVGNAEFMIGEAFYSLGEYENSIYHFEKLEKLDVPPLREYQARMQKINCLTGLKRFAEADQLLRIMLHNIRFNEYFSMIETKLANISEIQGDSDYAMEMYHDVLKKYPRKEGAALSAFYIGQLYEFVYGEMDSAKFYYDQVKKEFNKSEAIEESNKRSALLAEYLKIRNDYRKDQRDLDKLMRGDSTLIDSIAVEPSPEDTVQTTFPQHDNFATNFDSFNSFAETPMDSSTIDSTRDSINQVIDKMLNKKPKKVAVSRNPEEVEGSLKKNSFALGEFFLLKYENYDSAKYSYNYFVNNFEDSILTPKAYYALSFIYDNIYRDSLKTDSINSVILKKYPETIYAKKLKNEDVAETKQVNVADEKSKKLFHEAEDLLFNDKYEDAIRVYRQIAETDSGSIWAQKSRYAVAYVYEKYLTDTSEAIKTYSVLADEYPQTEFGKIAKNKIKEPPKEIPVTKAQNDSTQINQENFIQTDTTNTTQKQELKNSQESGNLNPASGTSDSTKTSILQEEAELKDSRIQPQKR